MNDVTEKDLEIKKSLERGELLLFFQEYVLENKLPPKWMTEHFTYLIEECDFAPVLMQTRRGPRKKASNIRIDLAMKFTDRREALRKTMSATAAMSEAAKEFGINLREADRWLAEINYIKKRLSADGMSLGPPLPEKTNSANNSDK